MSQGGEERKESQDKAVEGSRDARQALKEGQRKQKVSWKLEKTDRVWREARANGERRGRAEGANGGRREARMGEWGWRRVRGGGKGCREPGGRRERLESHGWA